MSGGLDEEEAAVDPTVLDVAVALGGEFLSKVGRVLVLDVFDNRVPATGGVSLCHIKLVDPRGIYHRSLLT